MCSFTFFDSSLRLSLNNLPLEMQHFFHHDHATNAQFAGPKTNGSTKPPHRDRHQFPRSCFFYAWSSTGSRWCGIWGSVGTRNTLGMVSFPFLCVIPKLMPDLGHEDTELGITKTWFLVNGYVAYLYSGLSFLFTIRICGWHSSVISDAVHPRIDLLVVGRSGAHKTHALRGLL